MSATLAEADVVVGTAPAQPCTVSEVRVCPNGCHEPKVVPCEHVAAFEVITRCVVGEDTETKLLCVLHEQMLRLIPELGMCGGCGGPAAIVAVIPLGAAS